MNGGKTAEVKLHRFQGMTDELAVLKNVKYWGTPRNDGFIMMPNELEAYREGPKAFEYKGTNGIYDHLRDGLEGCRQYKNCREVLNGSGRASMWQSGSLVFHSKVPYFLRPQSTQMGS